ncbi:unnamed protein product [Chilo suppressalis]|uniref:STAS domain-containing protein n=1 Tax=Chilo suppressalis TaxID=168631 RepID=A0ABN8AV65_CHISP|nr:hypothetical protein evm_005343 [Chilo suppressalis]CAH0397738.1 unnamed protein product [Chilo suppressalis]
MSGVICSEHITSMIGRPRESRLRRISKKVCSSESWRRRLPITIWLPKYNIDYLIRDIIAGVTVGLTSIPQGIAYAIIAGVPPQVGLYSSIFPGVVYMLFGSCKDVTVGPTAILAALLAKYVAYSVDFAYLAAFLSGCCILLLGVLQLGFLLDFISKPVISGFTTAAALQIAATQLKGLFRISGSSGHTFVSALINFFSNITTVQLWDTVLGIATIISLLVLKRLVLPVSATSSHCRVVTARIWQYFVRARNALVVFACTILAYILHLYGRTPFALTGKIHGGLPHFGPPPFSTRVANETIGFEGMLSVFGAEGFVMPLVAILESIAIAKAFAGSTSVDGSQEMLAIGFCNMLSSFCQCMPSTGSFTRTALNHASGVVTPAGSLFKASLVLLSVTLLTDAFYFIPRSTLAAIIMVAMSSLIDLKIIKQLWRNCKLQLMVYTSTVVVGVSAGLEYGIVAGAVLDVIRAMYIVARPNVTTHTFKVGNRDCVCIAIVGPLSYASAEHVSRMLRRHARTNVIVLDARHLTTVDIGVAENVISVILELESNHTFLLWNFPDKIRALLEDLHTGFGSRFVTGPSIDQHILGLDIERRDHVY